MIHFDRRSSRVAGAALLAATLTLTGPAPAPVGAASQAAPVRAPRTPKKPAAAPPSVAPTKRPTSIEQLQQDITAITQTTGVTRGIWGIAIQSIDRNERLFELNPHTLLVPASTAKLLSVATAVDTVGWNYRFETTLQSNGTITEGVLHGDLVVVGSGDPSIGSRGSDDLGAWIDALKAMGIRQIDGRIIGDDDLLEEPRPQFGWAWDDLATSGAIYGALNLEENRMTVTITPGIAGAAPALSVDPEASERPLINRALTGERGTPQLLWAEQRPGEVALTIAGSIPTNAMPAKLVVSVGNPTLWMARALKYRLISAGIAVGSDAVDIDDVAAPLDRSAMMTLYTHRSRPLTDLIGPLFKDSINLYGEAFFRLNAPGPAPTNDSAIEHMRQRLVMWGLAPDGEQLVDGSGLSRRDVVAADTMLGVLQRMYDRDPMAPWMVALPLAGVDGTLQNRMRSTLAERNVRAKTGSMSNVRSLAGYVTTRGGEHLAFAIILNNFEGTSAEANKAIDAIAVKLAQFTRPAPPAARPSPKPAASPSGR